MTRKQYTRKVMRLQRNINKYGEENGMSKSKATDKVKTPKWGTIITVGSQKGETLTSYKQAWEIICETLSDTGFLCGIE